MLRVGLAVAVGVFEEPKVGDAGEPDVALPGKHSRADPVGDMVEALSEDRGVIGFAHLGNQYGR